MLPQFQRGGFGGAGVVLSSTLPSPVGTAAIGVGGTAARHDHVHAAGVSLLLTGSAGAGFVEVLNQSSAPATPTSAGRIYFDNTNRLSWKGTNGFVRTFDGTANTADRVYTLPDATGNVVLDSATQTLTNKTLTQPVIANFVNATHAHDSSAHGGTLDLSAIVSGTLALALPITTGTGGSGVSVTYTGASSASTSAQLQLGTNDGGAMANNDRLGQILFVGNAGSGLVSGPLVIARTTELWSVGNNGSKIDFYTIPNTTNTQTEALSLGQDQSLTLFGALLWNTDNTKDIGASGANRPRNLWLAGSMALDGNIVINGASGMQLGTGASQKLGFWGTTAVIQQTLSAFTNSITSGGSTDVATDWTNLTTYATDAAAIRNASYQMARKINLICALLRTIGLGA